MSIYHYYYYYHSNVIIIVFIYILYYIDRESDMKISKAKCECQVMHDNNTQAQGIELAVHSLNEIIIMGTGTAMSNCVFVFHL